MENSIQNADDRRFLEEWRRQWLHGSFLSYLTKGSEPIENIFGKIRRGRNWGLSDLEISRIHDQAFSEAYKPNSSRYVEIQKFLNQK